MRLDPIVIRPYDPGWPESFAREEQRIAPVLRAWLVRDIEHMGSTSVPGLPAKPIIDMVAVVTDIDDARQAVGPMRDVGWLHAPHPTDDVDRQLSFCTPSVERRTHHLHVVEESAGYCDDWLVFRDYLRTHAEVAAAYAELKRGLATAHGQDPNQRSEYVNGKTDFVQRVLVLAHRP